MFRLLIHWLLGAISMMLVARIVPGFMINDIFTAMLAAAVVGLLNATLGAVLKMITFPIAVITFGLFVFVVNAAMILLASKMVSGFTVYGWTPAIWGSIVLSILTMLLRFIFNKEN